ncbi:MAG: T9SS type A sorting domain-containing protein, partial [candidate division KSB1 bacterium]|nr:T9SS type A sorting domain-containing protein [candidate division KSB1 bacterium]
NYLMKVGCWSFANYPRLFDGVIDEVTIWTRALSAEEIRELMCKKLTGTENGLAGYWDYEEGSGFTAHDRTSGGHDGWIFNEVGKAESGGTYTLTDNDKNWPTNSLAGRWIAITNGQGFKQRREIASNTANTITVAEAWTTIPDGTSYYALTSTKEWCTSTAPVGDASAWDFTGSAPSDFQVSLAHPNGDQVTVTGSSGTITGIQVYRIDAAPDNTTPPASWDHLDNTRYWGVILYGSGTPTYTFVYNYSGNPKVSQGNENFLGMAYRSGGNRNGLEEPWQDLGATLDTQANTLSKTDQTGTEYALIWNEPPVAVKVYDFNAHVTGDGKVLLTWRAAHESGIAGYLVYRAEDPNGEYRQISDGLIPCRTEGEPFYQFIDLHTANGSCTYKLQIVFLDGHKEWYGPINVLGTSVAHKNPAQTFRLCGAYPNPFNPCTDIQFDLPEDCFVRLQVFDIEGRLVAVLHQGELAAGSHHVRWDAENLSGGIYFIRLSAGAFSAVQRALLLK